MALNYLLDPMFQIENSAGKPATDGWLEVYIHGTRTKYYCASNFDGTLHPFKIKLDSLGSNIVLADDGQAYDVYAYNRFGSLLMSRYNVQPGSGGGGSVITGEMQHWIGMYGPTYTHFPGDDAGHTLGIPRQSVDYVGDFIDHISTAPYPDGDVPAYIYLRPGLYHIDCVIRYQQDTGDIKNTLDEVLVYTGHGNANEDVAYQLDASGPETNGNRHCLKQSFIRKVTEDDGGLLYFAPGTPTDWTDAYIQTLSIVKLDSIVSGSGGLHVVYHDETMTGEGTQDNPLSIQDALDGKQDTLTPGEGISIDSDGNISSETYSEGWGIDIDENNVISVDPDIIQQKLTPGEGINIDSDGNISANEYTEGWGIDIDENNVISVDPDIIQQKLTPGEGITIDSDGTITAEGEKYYEGWGIDINENNEISVDPDIIQKKITAGEGLSLDSDGNLNLDLPPIIPLVAGDGVTLTDSDGELIISAEGRQYTAGEGITIDGEGNISVDPNTVQEKLTAGQNIDIDSDGVISAVLPEEEEIEFEELDLDDYQTKLTAGQNITIDSNGVISAADGEHYSEGTGIDIDSDGVISVDQNTVAMKSDIPEEEEVQFDLFNPSAYQTALTAGNGINLDSSGNISVDTSVVQEKLTAGQNIDIDSDGVISAELPQEEEVQFDLFNPSAYQKALVAGNGINLDSAGNISVNTNVVQEKLTAGQNIDIDSDGVISAELPQEEEVDFEEIDLDDYQTKLTAGQNITIDSDGVISASGGPTYTAGNGIDITNDEISIDTDVVQEKLTAGQNIEIDSDGVISADLPQEEEVDFEELDLDDYQTKLTAGQNITIDSDGVISATGGGGSTYTAGNGIDITSDVISVDTNVVQEKLTAGQNVTIDSDGVISAAGGGEPCLWEDDSDTGLIMPKDGKHFEGIGAPTYSQVWSYYFAMKRLAKSTDDGFEIDLLRSSHTGDDTEFGPYSRTAFIKSDMSADPYMGADKAGLVLNSGKSGTGSHPASRVDIYAGSNGGYSFADYVAQTYVQSIVGNDYVRMRSDDIIRHSGNTDSHTPFITAQQSDTTKQYALKPTSISGNYTLEEVTGGGGQSYTAGSGIIIDSDGVISVDPSALPSYDSLPIEAGPGISIAVVDGKLRISLS